MALHVQLRRGGLFSGTLKALWDLDEDSLEQDVLSRRAKGRPLWVGGVEFPWQESKLEIFSGPQTSELPDFSPLLGPAAYVLAGHFKDVTGEYVLGPPGEDDTAAGLVSAPDFGRSVFLVHGRSVARREETARFLEQVLPGDHRLVILSDLANQGQTLLEKFEKAATVSGYAVVLLTPDDEGRLVGTEALEGRARQNVIFELGFFFGRLGRGRVAVLYETGVSRLSDIDGLGHIPLDEAGGWKVHLVRELKAAGIAASLDRIA